MEPEILQSIANSLALIAQAKAPVSQLSLGFGDAPKSQQYVFCNRGKGGVWYHLDDQSNPVIIEATALTGYAHSFKIEKVIRREKEVYKMNFFLEGDRTYVLESAHDSNFSKGLMSAIAMMTPDQLRQPITICPEASTKTAEVLFCNIYQDGKQIFAPYDEMTDFRKVCQTVMKNIELANGGTPTPPAAP